MFKTQLKFQKIVAIAMVIAAALTFVYSLGVMTDLYDMLYFAVEVEDGNYKTQVDGAELYYVMQPFNKLLLSFSIALILVSLTLFITNGHKRRLYYVGNYVTTGLAAVSNVAVAIWGMVEVSKYRAQFLQIDFEALKAFCEKYKRSYTESTFWFDIGYVVFALLIVAALVCVGNLIWKIIIMKREKELLSGNAKKEALA